MGTTRNFVIWSESHHYVNYLFNLILFVWKQMLVISSQQAVSYTLLMYFMFRARREKPRNQVRFHKATFYNCSYNAHLSFYSEWPSCKYAMGRSRHQRCSVNKDILKNSANFTGKQLKRDSKKRHQNETPTQLWTLLNF